VTTKRTQVVETKPAEVSIAVLPFADMSAAKDQEYLCEGMSEEIMNALVPIEGIRIASRTSSFRAGKSGEQNRSGPPANPQHGCVSQLSQGAASSSHRTLRAHGDDPSSRGVRCRAENAGHRE